MRQQCLPSTSACCCPDWARCLGQLQHLSAATTFNDTVYQSPSPLTQILVDLDAWASSHIPPAPDTPALQLPLELCMATQKALDAAVDLHVKLVSPVLAQLMNTTATYLHAAYLADGQMTLHPPTADLLAQQINATNLLRTLQEHVRTGLGSPAATVAAGVVCSASHIQHAYALVKLLLAIHQMWAVCSLAPEAAGRQTRDGIAVSAVQLAYLLLALAVQQPQLAAGVRASSIMADAMLLTHLLVQQLAAQLAQTAVPPGGAAACEAPLTSPLFDSPVFLLLVLVLWEHQALQLLLPAAAAAAVPAAATAAAEERPSTVGTTTSNSSNRSGLGGSSSTTSTSTISSSSSSSSSSSQLAITQLVQQYRWMLLDSTWRRQQQQQQQHDALAHSQQEWAAVMRSTHLPAVSDVSADYAATQKVLEQMLAGCAKKFKAGSQGVGGAFGILKPLLLLPVVLLHRASSCLAAISSSSGGGGRGGAGDGGGSSTAGNIRGNGGGGGSGGGDSVGGGVLQQQEQQLLGLLQMVQDVLLLLDPISKAILLVNQAGLCDVNGAEALGAVVQLSAQLLRQLATVNDNAAGPDSTAAAAAAATEGATVSSLLTVLNTAADTRKSYYDFRISIVCSVINILASLADVECMGLQQWGSAAQQLAAAAEAGLHQLAALTDAQWHNTSSMRRASWQSIIAQLLVHDDSATPGPIALALLGEGAGSSSRDGGSSSNSRGGSSSSSSTRGGGSSRSSIDSCSTTAVSIKGQMRLFSLVATAVKMFLFTEFASPWTEVNQVIAGFAFSGGGWKPHYRLLCSIETCAAHAITQHMDALSLSIRRRRHFSSSTSSTSSTSSSDSGSSPPSLLLAVAPWFAVWCRNFLPAAYLLRRLLGVRFMLNPDCCIGWVAGVCCVAGTLIGSVGILQHLLVSCYEMEARAAASRSSRSSSKNSFGATSSSCSGQETAASRNTASNSSSRVCMWPLVCSVPALTEAYWSNVNSTFEQQEQQQKLQRVLQLAHMVASAAASKSMELPGVDKFATDLRSCFEGLPDKAPAESEQQQQQQQAAAAADACRHCCHCCCHHCCSEVVALRSAADAKQLWQALQQSNHLTDLSKEVELFVAAMCAQLPVPHCCNHPNCSNMAGISELQLVGGKACICAGCRVARYCSSECQRSHWQQHKAVCKRLKQQQQRHFVNIDAASSSGGSRN